MHPGAIISALDYISVSNYKGIIDNFLIIANKYGWGRPIFMVDTGTGAKKIFRRVEPIQIADMHYQSHGNFGLLFIEKLRN